MESINTIVEYLMQDKIKNVSIINFIENYGVKSIKKIGDAVILRSKSDRDWVYISSNNDECFPLVIRELGEEDKCFAMIEDWMMPSIIKESKLKWRLSCMRMVLDEKIKIPLLVHEVLSLKLDDAKYIYENSMYKNFTSIEYIQDRINNGVSAGIYDSNKLIAWAMTHDHGAIGFLNVLEDYRGNGYARDITLHIINELRKKGKIPFACIEEDNKKSMSLIKKLGFREDRKIHWFEI